MAYPYTAAYPEHTEHYCQMVGNGTVHDAFPAGGFRDGSDRPNNVLPAVPTMVSENVTD